MKRQHVWQQALIFFLVIGFAACAGKNQVRTHVKSPAVSKSYSALVSWYGRPFHGRKTASGERYNMHALTAAHKTLPFDTWVRLTNPMTGQSTVVRINDRGPFVRGRDLDVSFGAAKKLGLIGPGHSTMQIEILKSAPVQDLNDKAAELAMPLAVQEKDPTRLALKTYKQGLRGR